MMIRNNRKEVREKKGRHFVVTKEIEQEDMMKEIEYKFCLNDWIPFAGDDLTVINILTGRETEILYND